MKISTVIIPTLKVKKKKTYYIFRAIRRALKPLTPSKNDTIQTALIHESTRVSQYDFSKLQSRTTRSARKHTRSRRRQTPTDTLITPRRRGTERRNEPKKRAQRAASRHD
ncbi:hypothetical protein NL108_011532 [Boleophthalmus pectinirostris]|nr:hypothetical protein NL108_011532 [Boleophthalmus pectinirostris]